VKGARYSHGMIVTSDDLNFTESSKSAAISQLGDNLLEDQTVTQGGASITTKGIIRGSGETPSFEDQPLKVYITGGTTVNIYSGTAYSCSEGKVYRIWVPNSPTDVPKTDSAAITNHDNIDAITEVQSRDFFTSARPSRTDIKTFTTSDASGTWYVCIRYAEGTYDPIVIPNDGSIVDSKTYESYVISVSRSHAAALSAEDGYNWIPLATLNWDGSTLSIESDDRVYASCTTTTQDKLIVDHQNIMHENCIISTDHTVLSLTVDNTLHRIYFSPPSFSGDSGLLINGYFVQNIANNSVSFDPTMSSGLYYLYIDVNGVFRATTNYTVANNGCLLGSCYYSSTSNLITMYSGTTAEMVRDRRQFGSIGKYQLASDILGEDYSAFDDLKIKDLSDELISHRDNSHGNGLYLGGGSAPYPAGSGSLAANISGTRVLVTGIASTDKLYLDGWECTQTWGNSYVDFTGYGTDTYIVYAVRSSLAPNPRYIELKICSRSTSISDNWYPICKVTWNGVSLSNLIDLRVYNTIGYNHIQKNRNAYGRNSLPQLLTCMWGVTPKINAESSSDYIYLSSDWSGTHSATNYAGGGTSSGSRVFATTPMIMVYRVGTLVVTDNRGWGGAGSGETLGYYVNFVSETSFKIYNLDDDAYAFYWIAIGPSYEDTITNILMGGDNPHYYW